MPHGGRRVAAMEGGSVGCVIWTVSGGGRVASVLYAILMTGCHLLILPLYVTYVLRWAGAGFDGGPLLCLLVALVTVGTAPLMWTRTTSCPRSCRTRRSGARLEAATRLLVQRAQQQVGARDHRRLGLGGAASAPSSTYGDAASSPSRALRLRLHLLRS